MGGLKVKASHRDEFRESCLRRDDNKCVVCGKGGRLAVHHIIERKLWRDGGYYSENGASLCDVHHLQAESTELSCETIRERAAIAQVVLPAGFDPSLRYSKWGDVLDGEGRIVSLGPLGSDDSRQKALAMKQGRGGMTRQDFRRRR